MQNIINYNKIIDPLEKTNFSWLEEVTKISKSIEDVKLTKDSRFSISVFLYLYPIKNEKVFNKLDGKSKMGYISRHIMSIGNKRGLSELVDKYFDIKEQAKYIGGVLKSDWWKIEEINAEMKLRNYVKEEKYKTELDIRKRDLKNFTMELVDILIKKYNKRLDNIEKVLESEK